jgi:hypothetical protein
MIRAFAYEAVEAPIRPRCHDSFLQVCRQHLCSGYHGVSKSGHLVWYDRIALMDPKGLVKSCRPEDYRRNFIWDTENMSM